jgi:acetyl esterase/lipase
LPILIFLYGGGLTGGERTPSAAAIPDSLVYANLGAFFASQGFVTLIPDYRRVEDTKAGTVEDAVYASGAEDLASVLACVEGGGLKHCKVMRGRAGTVRVLGVIFS